MISIVGAGPGDPDLLTVKARRRLDEADIVLYDALVNEAMLPPRARCIYVGKRAGRRSIRQDAIHRLMIRLARRGLRVVRLKGGDPFVLGRGGEEMLALRDAGLAYEVIPGISSSIAAAALSEIPVTHRGISSAFVVVSGASRSTVLDTLDPGSATLVILMGLATRGETADRLLARGWRAGTPAAVLLAAGTKDARTWIGTLSELTDADVDAGLAGTIVIGDVVNLARIPHAVHR